MVAMTWRISIGTLISIAIVALSASIINALALLVSRRESANKNQSRGRSSAHPMGSATESIDALMTLQPTFDVRRLPAIETTNVRAIYVWEKCARASSNPAVMTTNSKAQARECFAMVLAVL